MDSCLRLQHYTSICLITLFDSILNYLIYCDSSRKAQRCQPSFWRVGSQVHCLCVVPLAIWVSPRTSDANENQMKSSVLF